jgi:hypothetical protein
MPTAIVKTVPSLRGVVAGLLLAVSVLEGAGNAQDSLPLNPFGPSKKENKAKDEKHEEPASLNPFGQVKRERDDAIPGYVELSDGRVIAGDIYLTRDKRLKVYDAKIERQREIPLQKIKQIDCKVLKEWQEKEWRFKELALDKKYFTGRSYPAREYTHTITLQDDRTIDGPLSEVIYVQPYVYDPSKPMAYKPDVDPERFLLHKRDKGEMGTDLKSLVYVRVVKLGKEAYEEGKKKAARYRPSKTKDTDAKKPAKEKPEKE